MLKKRNSTTNKSLSLHRAAIEKPIANPVKRADKPPSYLYPLQKPAYIIPTTKSSKSTDLFTESDTEINDSLPTPPKEEEIKPKLVRPRNLEAHFKRILSEKQFENEKDNDEDQQLSNEEHFFQNDSVKYVADRSLEKKKSIGNINAKNVHRTKSAPIAHNNMDENDEGFQYRYPHQSKNIGHHSIEKLRKSRDSYDDDFEYNENLTDKEKYHKSLMKKQQTNQKHREYYDDGFRMKDSISPTQLRRESKSAHRIEPNHKPAKYYDAEERTIDSKKYRQKCKSTNYDDIEYERNHPYKEPIVRYKSYEDCDECDDECTSDCDREFISKSYPSKYRHGMYEQNDHVNSRQRIKDIKRISPDVHDAIKESFHQSREKFQQMERHRPSYVLEKEIEQRSYPMEKSNQLRRMGAIPRQEILDVNQSTHIKPPLLSRQNTMLDWSSEEEPFGSSTSPSNVRIIPREHYEKNTSSRMAPSKSLGNLVKGYRHSYAEPQQSARNQMPRNSGRVGLAAVNPY